MRINKEHLVGHIWFQFSEVPVDPESRIEIQNHLKAYRVDRPGMKPSIHFASIQVIGYKDVEYYLVMCSECVHMFLIPEYLWRSYHACLTN